jgi:hypothetical protein
MGPSEVLDPTLRDAVIASTALPPSSRPRPEGPRGGTSFIWHPLLHGTLGKKVPRLRCAARSSARHDGVNLPGSRSVGRRGARASRDTLQDSGEANSPHVESFKRRSRIHSANCASSRASPASASIARMASAFSKRRRQSLLARNSLATIQAVRLLPSAKP